MRHSSGQDTSGYGAGLDSNGFLFIFRVDASFDFTWYHQNPSNMVPTEEHFLQLDAFNGEVSLRAWRVGASMPSPQLVIGDAFAPHNQGFASLFAQDFTGELGDVTVTYRFVHASSSALTHSSMGDVNADGVVNVSDLLAVINAWGACPSPLPVAGCPVDIAPAPNGDGQVNVSDLLMVISNWG